MPISGLQLHRPTHPGSFFDVVGRRAAFFGYENREMEAWVYPLEILDGLALSFQLAGYPLEIDGRGIMSSIDVRPESTTIEYAHAAFTVRQIMFAPIDEPALVILLDVRSVLPLSITASFRPRLRLMWPATSMTSSLSWDAAAHAYTLSEETGKFAAVVGSPAAMDVSIMPYQEEPRDVANRFVIQPGADQNARLVPIVITGSVDGRAAAAATYERVLAAIPDLYRRTTDHYEQLQRDTIDVTTPEPRLDTAFRWAKVGLDKGLATNPLLGTGLLAGFRTAGDSERPGYAWFFGRDALWTALAADAEGAFETTRAALGFLRGYQRQDGKIPHEISQSASLVRWFDGYPYAWASADATPLYVIAHADYWRATGDRAFVAAAWPSIVKAYDFSAATDTDGNGLIENTNVGHGWVEGGALYPPHEEIYMQGLWIAASRGFADLADAMHDEAAAAKGRSAAERARVAMERTYWLADRGYYAFATASGSRLIGEDTVLPAVPLWFGAVENDRAQLELDHLGSAALATDWGSRILSNASTLYDPLSYHYGSVWPLFTGWQSVAAYRYGRPHIGYGALMANVLLTYPGALGYVTELLSGDFATPFGRSSHHQVWSEAMVIAPVVRGLLGIDVAPQAVTFAPALPPSWHRVDVRHVAAGSSTYDFTLERSSGRTAIHVTPHLTSASAGRRVILAPLFPGDTRIRRVTVNGRAIAPAITRVGDELRAQLNIDDVSAAADAVFTYDEGSNVEIEPETPAVGSTNRGLKVLRVHADGAALHLVVEGLPGRAYVIRLSSPRRVSAASETAVLPSEGDEQRIEIRFTGAPDRFVRRDIALPFR
jgi:hypothetical protein